MKKSLAENNKFWLWIIFIIYPLGAFIYSLKNFGIKRYHIFILLFFVFYGFTFLPIANSDGSRYKENFERTTVYSTTQYLNDLEDVFQGEADNPDFYAPTLRFVVKSFTNDTRVYFSLAALIYFYIFLKLMETIWELVVKEGVKYLISFFIGCFFIYNLSSGVNAIRFPLAFMVFSLGALNLIIKNEKKYLFISFLSVLIHFSLVFSCVFLLIAYIFKFKIKNSLLYILLLLVFLFGSLFPAFVEEYLDILGNASESKFEAYTQEGFVDTRVNHLQVWNWYVYFNFYSTYFFTLIALFITRLKIFKIKFDTTADKLFVFSFVMLIHALLSGSIVDVISNRFNLLFSLFTLIYLFYLSSKHYGNKLLVFLNYVYIPILIVNILIKFRADLYTFNSILVFGNFIISFFTEVNISIQEFLLG